MRAESCGAHKVREHHRDLAAFGSILRLWFRLSCAETALESSRIARSIFNLSPSAIPIPSFWSQSAICCIAAPGGFNAIRSGSAEFTCEPPAGGLHGLWPMFLAATPAALRPSARRSSAVTNSYGMTLDREWSERVATLALIGKVTKHRSSLNAARYCCRPIPGTNRRCPVRSLGFVSGSFEIWLQSWWPAESKGF